MSGNRPELVLIRHAPVAVPGRLAGRTDFPARIEAAQVAATQGLLPPIGAVVSSPARRCVETAQALFGGAPEEDARLWEQNFGAYDGAALADLPDLGEMSGATLAAHRWPEGESFEEICVRIAPAIAEAARRAEDMAGAVALVAHAGVIRAAMAGVLGSPSSGLAFEIAPLSVTRLGVWKGAPVSVRLVNGGGV